MIAFAPMRSIVVKDFGGPDVMRLEDLPTPAPTPTQVLVRVHAAGVNPVDTYIRSGTYAVKPPLPYTPGIDGAGEIVAAGSDVKGFKSGDRVYIFNDNTGAARTGTYSDHALLAATSVGHLPHGVSYAQGAALGVPYATAFYALFGRVHARAGETLLVHGASGGVGIAAVQMGRAHGLRVIGTAGTDRGMQAVKDAGAHVVINHREADYVEQVTKAADGRGVDVILEMNAHINLEKDIALLAKRGRIMLIGNRGRIEIDPRGVMGREAAIYGMVLFNVTPADLAWVHAGLGAGLANGTLRPLVGRELSLAEAPRAHEAVMEAGALGKIVLVQ